MTQDYVTGWVPAAHSVRVCSTMSQSQWGVMLVGDVVCCCMDKAMLPYDDIFDALFYQPALQCVPYCCESSCGWSAAD